LARSDSFKCALEISKFIGGGFGEAPPAADQVAGEAGQKFTTLGNEIPRIDAKSKLGFERFGDPGHHEKARVDLPVDDTRHRRRRNSGHLGQARNAPKTKLG